MIELFLSLLTSFIQAFLPESKTVEPAITATVASALVAAVVAILVGLVTGWVTWVGSLANINVAERHTRANAALEFESTLRHNETVKKTLDTTFLALNNSKNCLFITQK